MSNSKELLNSLVDMHNRIESSRSKSHHKFILVSPMHCQVEVVIHKSPYCPSAGVYFMPDKSTPFLEHVKTIYSAEKEMNAWIRAYDNAIKGLNYWKQRALHKEA